MKKTNIKKKKSRIAKRSVKKRSLKIVSANKEFLLNSLMNLRADLFTSQEQKSTRQGLGDALIEDEEMDKNVVVITADLAESTCTEGFRKKFPDRFFNVGIAEQNMLGISAGLAFSGKIPFATTFGVFGTGRAWDQLRTSICYPKANVKIAVTHCGITVGQNGATHQALSDIALTRTIPNLTVIVPCDYEQAKKAVLDAAECVGPVYIRLGRPKIPILTTEETPFEIGKADWYCEGRDINIIATGEMVYEALVAAKKLTEQGLSTGVLNIHTIKPLDENAIMRAAEAKIVVTAEDHHKIGGLGSAVAEVLSSMPKGEKPKQILVGIDDTFGKSGEPEELKKIFKITSDDIVSFALEELRVEKQYSKKS